MSESDNTYHQFLNPRAVLSVEESKKTLSHNFRKNVHLIFTLLLAKIQDYVE